METFSWFLPDGISGGQADLIKRQAFAQHAVLQRSQLYDVGVSERQVHHAVAGRRWQDVAGVIVLHNAELTPVQREEVATRVGVDLVALAARTAAAAEGLVNWPAPALEVVVPKGTTYPSLPFAVRVHESRRFVPDDVLDRSPARVRIERAIVDAAAWAESEQVSCGLLAAGVQQRLTTAERLKAQVASSGRLRRGRLLRSVLVDIEGGAQALSEITFVTYCKRRGLPKPELQQVRTDASGKRRYLDATFRRKDGSLLRVEIDGALHLLAASYWSDLSRGNELVIAAEQVLRFPSWLVHADHPVVADQIHRALGLSVLGDTPPACTDRQTKARG